MSEKKRYQANAENPFFSLRREWPVLVFLLLSFAAGLWAYPRLPEMVPGHWNMANEVDRYLPRFWGAFGLPLLAAGIYVLMLVTPLIDPKRENYSRFGAAYRVIRWGIVLVLLIEQGVILAAGLGFPVNVGMVVEGSISLLFILMGNQMGRIRFNYFVGIRTPWTLANEEVWRRTHRLGAWAFVLTGLVGLVATFLPAPFNAWVFFGALGTALVGTVLYSYLIYRQLEQAE